MNGGSGSTVGAIRRARSSTQNWRHTLARLSSASMAVGSVIALVVASAAMRAEVAPLLTAPWIAPDEMIYALLGQSLWSDGSLSFRGAPAPYYSLATPLVVGAGLAGGGDLDDGVARAQLLQTLAMSSTAVPVFIWARRLASDWWAVGAAAVSVAGPALTYGSLLMTEALFYPACSWALLALAAALERPTLLRQGVFMLAVTVAVSVRMQGLVLLPAFAVAVGLVVLMDRSVDAIRRALPLAAAILAAITAALLARAVAPEALGSSQLLGVYASVGSDGTSVSLQGGAVGIVEHVASLLLVGGCIPVAAATLVVWAVATRSVRSEPHRAFAATALAFTAVLVLQVVVFANGRIDFVSGRYLIVTVPLASVGLVAWIGADMPRRRLGAPACLLASIAALAVTDPARVVPADALHDSLATAWIRHVHESRPLLVALAALGVALVLVVPRRLAPVLVAVTLGVMVLASVDAARLAAHLSAAEDAAAHGSGVRDWIDRSATGRVTLLFSGDRPALTDARSVFWNSSVREVIDTSGGRWGGPLPAARARWDTDSGLVVDTAGAGLERKLVVVPASIGVRGTVLARSPRSSVAAPGLVLYRATTPLRVAWRIAGLTPAGELRGRALAVVPACSPGRLELRLLGLTADRVSVTVNGIPTSVASTPVGAVTTVALMAPAYADGMHRCEFLLETDGGTVQVTDVRLIAADLPT